MKLTVYERLLLRNIIPQMSGMNFAFMKQARELMESMFTEQEEAQLGIKEGAQPGQVEWRVKGDDGEPIIQEREIKISDALRAKIGSFLQILNAREQLSYNQASLLDKFVPDWDKEKKAAG